MSELLALGVSHKTAPLDLRERLSLTEGRAVSALRELTDAAGIHEAAAISTCNRTELYLIVSDPVEAESTALGVLTRQAEIRPTELLGHLYSLRSVEAARHLLRVTAGLDSMIVGEAEIQGQVKRAYELALVEGGTGPILNRLFRGALAAGGRAREETGISEKGVSIPSVAVELARRALGDLSDRRVLVVGAGETAELVARALVARGVRTVFVANRHYDRAIGLAQRFDGSAVRFEELPEQLEEADIVVTATNSPHHIVERDDLAQVMAARHERPLLAIDIAVPRDIEPACREIAGVSVHDIDDVQQIVERNTSGREAEAQPGGADHRGRAGPLRALARLARGGADDRRPARDAATRSCAASWPRTRVAGRASARPTASGWRRWRRRSPRASCTSRPCACAARPAARRPTSTSAPCASCSVSTSRPSRRRSRGSNVTELRRSNPGRGSV